MKKCPIREVFGLRKTLADESKNVRYVAHEVQIDGSLEHPLATIGPSL
jgi:hypothetical protein